jgi:hypothetical protein
MIYWIHIKGADVIVRKTQPFMARQGSPSE